MRMIIIFFALLFAVALILGVLWIGAVGRGQDRR